MGKIAQATVEDAGGAFGGGFGLGGPTETGAEAEAIGEPAAETPAPAEAEPATPPAAPEEEGGLLVTPGAEPGAGKRDDEWYKVTKTSDGKTTTNKSKDKWYMPVTTDKRDMGARKKNYLSLSGVEQGGTRKSHKGYHELNKLAKGVVNESNYNDEIERKVLLASQDIDNLINSLEKKKDETKS